MKVHYIFFVLFGAFSVACNGQNDDTHVADGRILFQHVFEGVIENPLEAIENWQGVDNVRDLDGAFFGDLIFRDIDVKRVSPELGLTYMNTMVFLRQADTKAQVQVEIRDGRYRVTVSDFIVHHTSTGTIFEGIVEPIETYCFKKNGVMRNKQWTQTKLVYDRILSDLFSSSAKPFVDPNDDW